MMRKAETARAISLEKINKSQYYPGLRLFTEYNFLQSQNQVGILKSNRSLGPSFGLSLQYNLFDGFNTRNEVKIARLGREISDLNYQQSRLDLQAALMEAFNDFMLQQELVKLEESSLQTAADNLEIARAQLKFGATTDLQFREVQAQYVQAEYRLTNARYLARLSELSLHYLSGGLLAYLKS
jgi:outer membrane protein TolC